MRLRLPNAMDSYEEGLRVYNEDIAEMSPVELEIARQETARIVARDPERLLWRGREYLTARQWGNERVAKIRARLSRAQAQTPKPRGHAWV